MNFKPVNRHLQVEVVNLPKEEKTKVLLPETYQKRDEKYKLCRVLEVASDCSVEYTKNSLVSVNSNMIERVRVLDEEVCLVLENYIMGVISE